MPPEVEEAVEEQLQLIDVDHPNAKAIKKLVGPYQRLLNERKALQLKEADARRKLVEKIREVGKANPDGVIAVKVGGISCVIKPDEKVKITFEGEGSAEGD